MSENGQAHTKILAVFAARFSKCVWPFRDIVHQRGISYVSGKFGNIRKSSKLIGDRG